MESNSVGSFKWAKFDKGCLFFFKMWKSVTRKESHHEESFTEVMVCMCVARLFSISVLLSVLHFAIVLHL